MILAHHTKDTRMLKPLALFIGLRYTRAKRKNHFISFISSVSIGGIALGVAALITVLSVMNGFDKELRERILGMASHVTVSGVQGQLPDWRDVEKNIENENFKEIRGIAPFVEGQAMLVHEGSTSFSLLYGVLPHEYANVSEVEKHMVQGNFSDLKSGEFNIILGKRLAESVGLAVGDSVVAIVPEGTLTPAGVLPRTKRFKLVGVFDVGYDYDRAIGYIAMPDAQKLYHLGDGVSGLQIKLDNLYAAPRIALELMMGLSSDYYVTDWTIQNGTFFAAVKLEKTLMFVMLSLIIAVAAFNILSTLVMVVTDKQSDIAILRTVGATPSHIMQIFFIQGSVIGIVGTLVGVVIGVLLALNATAIVAAIEHIFAVKLLSADVYYISFLPSQLLWSDVFKICGASLIMSFLATFYPAWRAAKVQPAEALRYE